MFIPLHDQNRLAHVPFPVVNLSLIAANVAAFLFVQNYGLEPAASASAFSHGDRKSVV